MVIQIEHHNNLITGLLPKPKNWIVALFSGRIHTWRMHRELQLIEYWWIELDPNTMLINRKICFDWSKKPTITNFEYDINIPDSLETIKSIDNMMFNDVWEVYRTRNFKKLELTHEKYLKLWGKSSSLSPPVFPILITNLETPDYDLEIVNEKEHVFQFVDIFGYEWDNSEQVVDSLGKIYDVEYLNFGHPVGVVIPSKIVGKIGQSEINDILKNENFEFKVSN
tara:strand:- start:2260 stop:2931 length:672 start_codon:yes stop_codon:yes gene_type:complete